MKKKARKSAKANEREKVLFVRPCDANVNHCLVVGWKWSDEEENAVEMHIFIDDLPELIGVAQRMLRNRKK